MSSSGMGTVSGAEGGVLINELSIKSACLKEFDSLVPSFICRSRRSEILLLRTCGCMGDRTGEDSSTDFSFLREDKGRGVGDKTLFVLFSSVALGGPEIDFSSAFLGRWALLLKIETKILTSRKNITQTQALLINFG